MKVVVVVKKGLGGNGISQAARYISTRERDEEREGLDTRPLFSDSEERLTHAEANRFLGNGREPKTEDVLHLVISFHREEDFKQLGMDEKARQTSVRKITRSTSQQMADVLNAEALRWVAGIHRNTDNPHVHLLIHRDYVDRRTGRIKRLHTLPKEMRVSWGKAEDGARIIKPGSFSQTFEKHCEQVIRQGREEQQRQLQEVTRERLKLGQALLAEERIHQLQESLRTVSSFGEWRRYQVADAQGRSRLISEFDLKQRADVRERQMLTEGKLNLPPKRYTQGQPDAVVRETYEDIGITERIRLARASDRSAIERKLQQTLFTSQPILNETAIIHKKYEQAGIQSPIPILSRADLAQLQHRAIFYGDAEKLKQLETIRGALAAEKGEPVRTETEIARLQVQLFIARSSLKVEKQSATRLEETKHLRQWKMGGEGHALNSSLANIETALAYAADQAKFIGARRLHWNADKRAEAREQADKLTEHRATVLSRIADTRATLANEITRRAELVKALDEIYTEEQKRYQQDDRKLPAPLFTSQNLRELNAHAARRREPQFYQTLVMIKRTFSAHDQRAPHEKAREECSRASAREIIAGIEMRESAARLEKFAAQREKMMVVVKENDTEITLARLVDVAPKSPLESLFRPFLVRREKYLALEKAVSAYGERLRQQHGQNEAIHTILSGAAQASAREFVRLNPELPLPRPQFTAREIHLIELQIIKERDPVQREQYAKLYREAVDETVPAISRSIILNQTEAREVFGLVDHQLLLREDREQGEIPFTR